MSGRLHYVRQLFDIYSRPAHVGESGLKGTVCLLTVFIYRCCWNCASNGGEGKEVCMECVLECEVQGQSAYAEVVTCSTCGELITLTRMLSDAMLESLRCVAQVTVISALVRGY